jgi:hypothetical protein
MIRAGKWHVVHVDRRTHSCTCCERNVDRSECVRLHAPLESAYDSFPEALETRRDVSLVTHVLRDSLSVGSYKSAIQLSFIFHQLHWQFR